MTWKLRHNPQDDVSHILAAAERQGIVLADVEDEAQPVGFAALVTHDRSDDDQ